MYLRVIVDNFPMYDKNLFQIYSRVIFSNLLILFIVIIQIL